MKYCRYVFGLVFALGMLLTAQGWSSSLCHDEKNVAVSMQNRHMIVFEATQKEIYGTYFFGVNNTEDRDVSAVVHLLYPKNVKRLRALEGLNEEDIRFQDKRFVVSKSFAVGVSVMALQFSVALSGMSEQDLSFELPCSMDRLWILRHKTSPMRLFAKGFEPGLPSMLASGDLLGLVKQDLLAGQRLVLRVSSLPEGRLPYTILAVSIAAILLVSTTILVIVGRNTSLL